MTESTLTPQDEELGDLEEALATWRAELEQTYHPDAQEALRAKIRAARAALAQLEAEPAATD